jgi:hypothetical protein
MLPIAQVYLFNLTPKPNKLWPEAKFLNIN